MESYFYRLRVYLLTLRWVFLIYCLGTYEPNFTSACEVCFVHLNLIPKMHARAGLYTYTNITEIAFT